MTPDSPDPVATSPDPRVRPADPGPRVSEDPLGRPVSVDPRDRRDPRATWDRLDHPASKDLEVAMVDRVHRGSVEEPDYPEMWDQTDSLALQVMTPTHSHCLSH